MFPRHTIRLVDGVLVVDGTGDAVELWSALRAFFLERRPYAWGKDGMRYPETTTLEVLEVCTVFDRELARAPGDAIGLDTEAGHWIRATRRAEALAHGHYLDEAYQDNEGFWLRDTKRLAVYLAIARDLPTRTQMIKEIIERGRRSS
jgi:hypothetical protein